MRRRPKSTISIFRIIVPYLIYIRFWIVLYYIKNDHKDRVDRASLESKHFFELKKMMISTSTDMNHTVILLLSTFDLIKLFDL